MPNLELNKIERRFNENFIDLYEKGLITDEDLINHSKSDIHSWLQYLLIKSGDQENIISIPEVKIRFTKPIYYEKFGLKRKVNRKNFNRVDVAFYNQDKTRLGIAEIFSMDASHGARESKQLAKKPDSWLTPYDSIPHMINNSDPKPKFIIFIVILMENASHIYWKTKIPYIDEKLKKTCNYYDTFIDSWRDFKNKINIEKSFMIISEKGVEKI